MTDCPFRFVVQWNLAKDSLSRMDISYTTTPFRHVLLRRILRHVKLSGGWDALCRRKEIAHLRLPIGERSECAQLDVDSMVRAHSAGLVGGDNNEATARELEVFAASDTENISFIADTDLRTCVEFSAVLVNFFSSIVPTSPTGNFQDLSSTNQSFSMYNYQLLKFMTMNEYGESAVVQHSLLEANGDWHMDKAIMHFKKTHPTKIKSLPVVMVDNDMNEIRVLENHFPEARVLICYFNIIKYLKEIRGNVDIHKTIYADSDATYEAAHSALKGLCDRIGNSGFFTYFEKNWHNCQERWIMHHRADLPLFRNHTNNRLEGFLGKLKDGVDGSMSMAQCVKSLVASTYVWKLPSFSNRAVRELELG
ncbi:LOW QUALITY PROTEIN: hypothetical protein PHMEG_00016700 [Phytophthora megakarya]|uniref:ZSWIM1/3 RNaseH-like domain-containing protein n=1 Tax=Phytophthora megakarya TaxID=4795 RepID=A0A225VZQ2_9STRA|nr:LOW QUALITY PROTEIN: hypothetical protein PHMEG_00016700 [Phytophthora megakarya]